MTTDDLLLFLETEQGVSTCLHTPRSIILHIYINYIIVYIIIYIFIIMCLYSLCACMLMHGYNQGQCLKKNYIFLATYFFTYKFTAQEGCYAYIFWFVDQTSFHMGNIPIYLFLLSTK